VAAIACELCRRPGDLPLEPFEPRSSPLNPWRICTNTVRSFVKVHELVNPSVK